MTGRHGPCPCSLARERRRSRRSPIRADPASKPSLPRPHAELAISREVSSPRDCGSLTPCTQTNGPSLASSSARGRPETPRRDVRCRFERSENARQRPSPSRTRKARPKMDVPKPRGPPAGFARRGLSREGLETLLRVSMTVDALLAQARRSRAPLSRILLLLTRLTERAPSRPSQTLLFAPPGRVRR
jgi:hypothetical protein